MSLEANQPNTDISTKLFFIKLANVLIQTRYLFEKSSQSVSQWQPSNQPVNEVVIWSVHWSVLEYWIHLVQSICQSIRKSMSQFSFIHFNHQSFNLKVFWVVTGCFCKHEFWCKILCLPQCGMSNSGYCLSVLRYNQNPSQLDALNTLTS